MLGSSSMLLLVGVLLCSAAVGSGLEREREAGAVEAVADVETTEQTPVTSLKPIHTDGDPNKEVTDVDGAQAGVPQCSQLICHLKCELHGCIRSECLDNERCRCYCPRRVDPLQAFFSSILSSHLEPGLVVRVRPFVVSVPQATPADEPNTKDTSPPSSSEEDSSVASRSWPGLAVSRFGSGFFPDFKKLFEEASNTKGVYSKLFQTMQQTCRKEEDCSLACRNCTSTVCTDGLCQCSECNQREGVEQRGAGPTALQTCRSARNCIDHCKDCHVTTCRYGVCECGQCSSSGDAGVAGAEDSDASEPATDAVPSNDGSTTPAPAPGASQDDDTDKPSAAGTTEVISVRTNETLSEPEANAVAGSRGGRCVPKKCNHSCWERQCTKWSCKGGHCECDGCPEEVAVIVKNPMDGQPEKLQDGTATVAGEEADRNKYEIIF